MGPPHSPEARLLGPAPSVQAWPRLPSLSPRCFQRPFSADVVPNPCPKPWSPQAPLPAVSSFLSQSLPQNCLRWAQSAVLVWTLPGPKTHLPRVLCCHHIYKRNVK